MEVRKENPRKQIVADIQTYKMKIMQAKQQNETLRKLGRNGRERKKEKRKRMGKKAVCMEGCMYV